MFAFLIDPAGWTEIGGDAFAPGFFVWNSEVGRRSLGVQTFWFQAVCQNHIVWDAVDVFEFTRKQRANVHEKLIFDALSGCWLERPSLYRPPTLFARLERQCGLMNTQSQF